MSHFCIFGCRAYMFLLSKVHANKLVPYSKLIIFIGYEDNGYCFIYHIQENIIFCPTHTIFNKELFSKYTGSYAKEHKLYNKLLNKISFKIESSAPNPFGKDRLTPVPILYISISPIQNNSPTYSLSSFISYKPPSFLSTPESKKPIVEIEEDDNVDSDIEIQPLSLQ